MRRNPMPIIAMLGLVSPLFATPAAAANRTLTGTISVLGVQSTTQNIPEVVDIVLSAPLAATGCPGGTRGFEFDSRSVTDAQTRKNMLAALLGAKLAGASVTIVYDDGSTSCSVDGFAIPVSIQLS